MEHGCVFEEKVGCKADDKQIGMVTKENEESGLSKKVYQLAGRNRTVLGPADEGSMCPADKNSKCSGLPLRMMDAIQHIHRLIQEKLEADPI